MRNMFNNLTQHIYHKVLRTVLIITVAIFACTISGFFNPQTTNAQYAVTVVNPEMRINTLKNTVNEVANSSVAWKENVLDPIAWAVAKQLVKEMTADIVDWINSGFEGSPAFASDLKGTLLRAADLAVGDFIANDPNLSFLCSPFELDIKLALITSYQETVGAGGGEATAKTACTLDDVTDNVEGFLSGNFQDGGWDSWFEVAQNPERNTPTGARMAAEAEMYYRILDEQNIIQTELDWGDGFFSLKLCNDGSIQGPGDPTKECDITTPAQLISDQLNRAMGVPIDSLITADEIGEIIGALLNQLINQVFYGDSGLRGLSSEGGESYTTTLREEQEITNTEKGLESIDRDIQTVTSYLTQANRFNSRYDRVTNYLDTARTIYPRCNDLYANPGDDTLAGERQQVLTLQPLAESTLTTLQSLEASFATANTAAAQADFAATINDLRESIGQLSVQAIELQFYINQEMDEDIAGALDRITNEALACTPNASTVTSATAITNTLDDLEDLLDAANRANVPRRAETDIEQEISSYEARRNDLLDNT